MTIRLKVRASRSYRRQTVDKTGRSIASCWCLRRGTLVMALIAAATAHAGDNPFTVDSTNDGIDVFDQGKQVFHYQLGMKSLDGKVPRANYIHPLYDLDGNVLTEDFPADHKHHRGIFWAWHQVLIGDKHIGDQWACKNFEWDHIDSECTANKDGTYSVRVKVQWKSPDWMKGGKQIKQIPIAEEDVTVRVHPASKTHRMIDFDIRLLALVPKLRIGGSNNKKGYGGFSLRIKDPLELRLRGKSGDVKAKTTAVDAGKWLEISNKDDKHNRVIVLNHKSHPSFPPKWILRNHAKSMQNVVYPGQHPVPVSADPDKPLTLRYRVIIHRGEADTKTIETWQAEYEATP